MIGLCGMVSLGRTETVYMYCVSRAYTRRVQRRSYFVARISARRSLPVAVFFVSRARACRFAAGGGTRYLTVLIHSDVRLCETKEGPQRGPPPTRRMAHHVAHLCGDYLSTA